MPCCPAVIDIWKKEEPGFPNIPGKRKTSFSCYERRFWIFWQKKKFLRRKRFSLLSISFWI